MQSVLINEDLVYIGGKDILKVYSIKNKFAFV
jgi:hypothetical protein